MGRRSPFPRKDVEKLMDHLESKEDCKVKRTKNGYWVGFPNGETTTIHLSLSDARAVKNVKSFVVKQGCAWPL